MKKFICLLIVLTLCTSTAFAQNTAFEAVTDELAELGIMQGDPDGNLRLDEEVTRAEMAKIITAALGMSVIEQTETVFDDVQKTYWASGYIDTAQKFGIIHGNGDGTFAPEDSVTNEQVIKMIVCALGYEPLALSRGGYPLGHIQIANTYGMLEGVDFVGTENALRGDVALLISNALDIPLIKQAGFGTNIEYQIMNGKNNVPLETLRTQYFN